MNEKHIKKEVMITCILFQFQVCLSGHVNSPEQKLRVDRRMH